MIAHVNLALILFSALSFLGYGAACFLSTYLTREFDRYRLGSQRALVGALRLGAAISLVAGLSQPWLGRAAAGQGETGRGADTHHSGEWSALLSLI